MQDTQSTFTPGTIIRGRYVVEDLLGKGKFGAVYLVRDVRDDQKLFTLKEVIYPGRKELHRSIFDSMMLRRLHHPALPRVNNVFNRHDRLYILAGYIEGPNLEIAQQLEPEKRFSLPEVMTLMAPIMDAVTYLHSRHPPLVHRDIKPSNIILPKADSGTMLVDFGIATEYDSALIAAVALQGISGYRAPEQYGGETSPRTDIYSFGAVLYMLLTGIVPIDASHRSAKLGNKQHDPLLLVNQVVPTIPITVAQAIHRAMSINTNDRFSTMEQFWDALWQVPNEVDPLFVTKTTMQQIPEPNIAPSDSPHMPVIREEVKMPVTLSLQKRPRVQRFRKPSLLLLVSFALFVILLTSVGVGINLLFYAADHRGHSSALPTSARQVGQTSPHPTASPPSRITSTSVTAPSPYPIIVALYVGTLHDIPTGTTTNISLMHIQQQHGDIAGYLGGMPGNSLFNGIPQNGPFTGTVNTAKQIQFIVTTEAGQYAFSFEGQLQSDGNIGGTYCGPETPTGKCSDYGVWSASPKG